MKKLKYIMYIPIFLFFAIGFIGLVFFAIAERLGNKFDLI